VIDRKVGISSGLGGLAPVADPSHPNALCRAKREHANLVITCRFVRVILSWRLPLLARKRSLVEKPLEMHIGRFVQNPHSNRNAYKRSVIKALIKAADVPSLVVTL
jgi:hypothetical protein